jgi:hypothetical protein
MKLYGATLVRVEPAPQALAAGIEPRTPFNSKTAKVASMMTFAVSFDRACPGALRISIALLRGLRRVSRTRVLFASIRSYFR